MIEDPNTQAVTERVGKRKSIRHIQHTRARESLPSLRKGGPFRSGPQTILISAPIVNASALQPITNNCRRKDVAARSAVKLELLIADISTYARAWQCRVPASRPRRACSTEVDPTWGRMVVRMTAQDLLACSQNG